MRLNNVRLINQQQPVSISVEDGRITSIAATGIHYKDDIAIPFENAFAFPGLINSHDHLDFNCFSPLGNKKYDHYTEWGKDVHQNYKQEIDAVMRIPQHLRVAWGIYKNLLAGITTVVNHGEKLIIGSLLINVLQDVQNLHSVAFEKNWKWKLNNPFHKDQRCIIHAGEGTNGAAAAEIDSLTRWNILKRKLIAVHGVAMTAKQAKHFEALVWCPESNAVLLDKHADIKTLKAAVRVLFGTDSTLTGDWNIWEHLRLARELKSLDDEELFDAVSSSPAKTWNQNTGLLRAGKDADIVVAASNQSSITWSEFYQTNPQNILLLMVKGKIRLADESIFSQLAPQEYSSFTPVTVGSSVKFVEGDLPGLMSSISSYYPSATFPCQVVNLKEPVHA
jgi:cytosine/adenosine deaminase-related metal-dependent hydrolase